AVRAHLGADEALIEYHVGRRGAWLFLLDQEALGVWRLPGAEDLRERVAALRGQLARPRLLGAAQYARLAHGLHQRLLGPAAARLARTRRLIVVPDGPLWELPFEALVTAPTGSQYARLPYLVRRWPVAYAASASVLVSLSERSAGPALGSPEL